MKLEEYINKLDNHEDELEGGLLSELDVDIPPELHSKIMESVKNENIRVRRGRYKRYISAAVVLVLILSIGRLSGMFNRSYSEKDSLMSQNAAQKSTSTADSGADQNSSFAGTEDYRNMKIPPAAAGAVDKNGSYTIIADKNSRKLIDYINKNGVLLDKDIYKLNKSVIDDLNNIINSNKITVIRNDSLKEKYNVYCNNDYIIIELVIRQP